jgi:hypothetical protein
MVGKVQSLGGLEVTAKRALESIVAEGSVGALKLLN